MPKAAWCASTEAWGQRCSRAPSPALGTPPPTRVRARAARAGPARGRQQPGPRLRAKQPAPAWRAAPPSPHRHAGAADGQESTRNLPVALKTMAASASAGLFRIFLMPVDAAKTIMQARCAPPAATQLCPAGTGSLWSVWGARAAEGAQGGAAARACTLPTAADQTRRWRAPTVSASLWPRCALAGRACSTTARWRPLQPPLLGERPPSARLPRHAPAAKHVAGLQTKLPPD